MFYDFTSTKGKSIPKFNSFTSAIPIMIFLPSGGKQRPFPLWKAVGEEGFEPPTPWFVATCSNPLSYRPHSVSTGSVPGSTLKKRNLCSPQPFRVKKMSKRLYLYKNGAFRGVKWERGDAIIGVLNKTTFWFYFSFFFILKKYEEREVWSFLSSWRRAIFPQDLPYSIVTAVEFNHQVRDGLVWFLYA